MEMRIDIFGRAIWWAVGLWVVAVICVVRDAGSGIEDYGFGAAIYMAILAAALECLQLARIGRRVPQVVIEGGSWVLGPGSAPRVDGSYGMDGSTLIGAECQRNWLLRGTDVNQGIMDSARFIGDAPGAMLDKMQ